MDYKSFEYMRKTLPNEFNWSILYQLFSEDEIELSETAENYLRTTPWNTNLTIFEEILTTGDDSEDQYSTTLFSETVTTVESVHDYSQSITTYTGNISGDIKVIFNNKTYICSPTGDQIFAYGAPYDSESGKCDFSQYPFRIDKAPLSSIVLWTETPGTYTITVKTPEV